MRFQVQRALLGAGLLLFAACQNPAVALPPGRIRASLESSNEAAPELRVWVEGSSGLFLTGALVRVTSPSGEVTVVGYSPSSGCFETALAGTNDGTFLVEVGSTAWDQPRTISLVHKILRLKPVFQTLGDGAGDALLGAALGSNLGLTLGWSPSPGTTSSFVQISEGGTVLWSAAVTGSLALVPAGTLEPGYYSASVTCQFLDGDPLFQSTSYYSTSHASSVAVQFHLQ